MNRENVLAAINIMWRAENLDMTEYQESTEEAGQIVKTEAELHSCGNSACFAGYVAISPEFQASGGSADYEGAPLFDGSSGHWAIAKWLGVPPRLAHALVFEEPGMFYPVPLDDVKPEHVIEKLELILSGELE